MSLGKSKIRNHPSPNFGERRGVAAPDLVVLHYTGMDTAEAAIARLTDPSSEVSAHYLVDINGAVMRLVAEEMRAWHAGASSCMGREAVNDFSIGIELEGCDDDDFAMAQYQTLFALTSSLISAIPTLSAEHIYGHADISPGRKTDPGPGFDWEAYRLALSSQGFKMASKDTDGL